MSSLNFIRKCVIVGLCPGLHLSLFSSVYSHIAVADPGFPVGGGVDLVRGAVDPRGGYVSKILHVKMKESGPVGGGARRARPPLDPPMY